MPATKLGELGASASVDGQGPPLGLTAEAKELDGLALGACGADHGVRVRGGGVSAADRRRDQRGAGAFEEVEIDVFDRQLRVVGEVGGELAGGRVRFDTAGELGDDAGLGVLDVEVEGEERAERIVIGGGEIDRAVQGLGERLAALGVEDQFVFSVALGEHGTGDVDGAELGGVGAGRRVRVEVDPIGGKTDLVGRAGGEAVGLGGVDGHPRRQGDDGVAEGAGGAGCGLAVLAEAVFLGHMEVEVEARGRVDRVGGGGGGDRRLEFDRAAVADRGRVAADVGTLVGRRL